MSMSLKAWRRARGITQERMAKSLGIHVNTYINWENEPQKMSIEYGMKASEVLGVDFNDIIFMPQNATVM